MKTMNTPNAFGFITVGLVMEGLQFLPEVTGVRELWLMIMGGVLLMVGSLVLAQAAWLRASPHVAASVQAVALRRAEIQTRRGEQAAANAPGRITI